MTERVLPRYPIYVPSKGRYRNSQTANFLLRDGTPFRFVVEAEEEQAYREHYPTADIIVCPVADGQGSLPVRNWIRDLSIQEGHERHWQLDDNIWAIWRLYRGHRIRADSGVALRVCETFTDRYTNIGVSGLNYMMFVTDDAPVPYYLNCHVYSCCLVWNRMPYRWRLRYNEDTDLCLQVLSGGLCTVALNVFMAHKQRTLHARGGNTDSIYRGDGRAHMARTLERAWPYVVETRRKYSRPQHHVRGAWRGFDTPLQRRQDIDWSALPPVDEFGLELRQTGTEVRSPVLRALLEDATSLPSPPDES